MADVELGLLIITVVLVGLTFVLAYLTWQNVCAAKDSVRAAQENVRAAYKLIELQIEPFVFIGMRLESILRASRVSVGWSSPPETELLVFIQNTGGSSALNIKIVDFTYDFPGFKQTSIVKEGGIEELAPGQEIPLVWLLRGQVSGLDSVEVVFIYETSLGKLKLDSNVLDFPSYMNSTSPIY